MKSIVCLIFLCLVASLDGRYRCDYTYFREAEGWLKLHRIPANWHEARLRCHLEGGVLASPLNSGLLGAMQTLIGQSGCPKCSIFTGIHATFSRGDFFSVEGVHLLEIPHSWAANEPNNLGNQESCLAMLADGNLADVSCSNNVYPYFCYKKAPEDVQLNECGTLDDEYKLDIRTGSCYKFHRVPRTWSRAYMACAAEGGYLAIINSEVEATVLKELFDRNYEMWLHRERYQDTVFIGLQDWGEHGDWLTIDGRSIRDAGYSSFAGREPNNSTGDEFCLTMHRDGLLDDRGCENKLVFICEKRPDSPVCARSLM